MKNLSARVYGINDAARAFYLFAAICLAAVSIDGAAACAAEKTVTWKPAQQALLRVDDRPAKVWNVYQDGKKTTPLLVQIGTRYLLVDSRKQEIFEIDPSKIGHRGAEVTWNPADLPAMPLETSDWMVRDVGLAYKVTARLVAESHMLDVQLPHPLDIRSVY